MMIRLYMDEDSMRHRVVEALRARGVDVVTALDMGMTEVPDEEHLAWATMHERVLYSFNVGDFYHLHTVWLAQGRSHAGIILAPQQRYSVGDQMRRLLRLIAARSAEEMRDHVEFLSAWS
jgi:hypothetical protein